MMRKNSKRAIRTAFSAAMILSLFQPFAVLAETQGPAVPAKGFCVKIAKATSRVDQEVAVQEVKLAKKRQTRIDDLIRRRDKRDDHREANYAKWEADQRKHYAKFEARAQTEIQKQAVANFKSAIDVSIASRKQAIDAVIKTFREGMDQIIANRKPQEDAFIASFKASVSAVLEKAKSDCSSGIDPKTVKTTFNQGMKEGRHKLQTDRKNLEKNNELIAPLETTRKQATEKANRDFRSAVEKARADLKAAFKSK